MNGRHSRGICVVALSFLPVVAQAATVTVDANANRRAIDPRIYGVAYATTAQLLDLNVPLHRSGGNLTTRYNWLQNAANHDFDYYFESIAEGPGIPGEAADNFVQDSKNGLAQPMLTIPMIGWAAKLGPGRSILPSFSVAKYGAQCDTDPFLPDAGDGKKAPCGVFPPNYVTGNDPNDANVPADANFQRAWVQHLVDQWGTAASGGVRYYVLDNEHSIWFSTHRDVHPVGPHATEIRDKMIEYSTMIKSLDPGAVVMGPEEYGWTGYIFSGYDQQWSAANGYNNIPDRTMVMGGMDYMPWLLGQLKQSYINTGVKPIDVFSLHYYPHDNEFSNSVDAATQLQRNQSTRALWDPNLFDNSYIQDYVKLIPRMRDWVNTNYIPGTPIAITEYNWGAENHINGATAQADIYGIFGREGLDIGARWTTPATNTPTYKAMKMYRNYDGAKNGFGETNVSTVVPNPDNLSAFSALRTVDGALTIMVVNKVASSEPLTLNLSNFAGTGVAQVWQLTSANTIAHPADISYLNNSLSTTLPAQSITLFVLPPAPAGLAVVVAYSRRTHGALGSFDLPLDRSKTIGADVTVEPRFLATTHTIVFQMNTAVASTGAVTVVDAAAMPVGSPVVTRNGNDVRVTLTGLADNQRINVKVLNINNEGVDAEVSLGFLAGDVGSTRKISAADISAVKAHGNQLVDVNNARFDIDASGTVDAADVSIIKARSGRVLQ